jgi:hypothetical protein
MNKVLFLSVLCIVSGLLYADIFTFKTEHMSGSG